MQIRWLTAFLDFRSDRFGDEVTFWRAIAGSTVSPPRGSHREFASLEPFSGDPHLRVQRIGEGVGGIHLDFAVDDVTAATAEAISLGATLIGQQNLHRPTRALSTLSSPAGFIFCIVAWDGASQRARPIRWPGDTISIIDQVSIDVPADRFDAELDFWTRLTSWDPLPTSRPELTRLRRDSNLALGIILQRLGFSDSGQSATGHLDLASNAVDDEVIRHEEWGARVVERFANWTVMADPIGRRYCITSRNPRTGE